MGGGEKKWDATAERDLCIAVIMASQEGRLTYNWPKTHAIMESIGHGFTKDAMSQHFTKKIMKYFKTRHGDVVSSAPKTPQKAARGKRKAPSAKAAEELAEMRPSDDDDDSSKLAMPSSKRAKAGKKQPPSIKKEKPVKPDQGVTAKIDEAKFRGWLEEEEKVI